MVGGRLIEIAPDRLVDNGQAVMRLWCMDRNGDECCVYSEPFEPKDGPQLGEEIWWQSGQIMFDKDRKRLRKIGYSFSAPGTEGTMACNYARLCGRLAVDGADVGPLLIAQGLARPYRYTPSRPMPPASWGCP